MTLDPGVGRPAAHPNAESGAPATGSAGSPTEPGRRARWERWALSVLLGCSTALYVVGLGATGWANTFYAAAVQAGTQSWVAFFFGSLDPANAVTVDKSPAALWPMEIAGRVFGFSPWSMLLPQALTGVATVALLSAAVRRVAGPAAGLLAGALLALTPVAALMFRFNNPDALLTLLVTAAAYLTGRAMEQADRPAGTRRLAAAGAVLGLAFLAKGLAAFLVVPGLAGAYLVAASGSFGRRLGQLAGAGVAVVAGAGWWLVAVALWPAPTRPYIGGSGDNTPLGQLLGTNGLDRLVGQDPVGAAPSASTPIGTILGGAPGPLRLLNEKLAGQTSWLLPAALVLLAAALWVTRSTARTDATRAALLLWGGWTVAAAAVFSVMQGVIHPYYTVVLAPGIAALCAVGSATLLRHRGPAGVRVVSAIVLAVVVAGTAALAWRVLGWSPSFLPGLRWVVAGVGIAAAAGLLTAAGRRRFGIVAAAALVAVTAAPAAYTVQTAVTPHNSFTDAAGPAVVDPNGPASASPASEQISPELVARLQRAGTRWAAATIGSSVAANMQLAAGPGVAVFGIGGFSGGEPFPPLTQFQGFVGAGQLRYLITGPAGLDAPGGKTGVGAQIQAWVRAHYPSVKLGERTVYDLATPLG